MKISIKNMKLVDSTPLCAFADVILEGSFVIKNVKVIKKDTGDMFTGMPSSFDEGLGRWVDVCHPITQDLRKAIDLAVISEYTKMIADTESNSVE